MNKINIICLTLLLLVAANSLQAQVREETYVYEKTTFDSDLSAAVISKYLAAARLTAVIAKELAALSDILKSSNQQQLLVALDHLLKFKVASAAANRNKYTVKLQAYIKPKALAKKTELFLTNSLLIKALVEVHKHEKELILDIRNSAEQTNPVRVV